VNIADSNYILKCPLCSREYQDDEKFRMKCDLEDNGKHPPALLKAVYKKKQIEYKPDLLGVFAYLDWLPTNYHYIDSDILGKPYTYKSEGLANRLGLKKLYIAFSGYWPEAGVSLTTRTFKEFECQVNYVRYLVANHKSSNVRPFIVASAGNTANGYNLLSSILEVPVFLSIPLTGLKNIVLPYKTSPFIVCVKGDYSDAIDLANLLSQKLNLVNDGGVRSVGRRAGLGAVMLNAVAHPEYGTKELFHHYFQAVGSGAGAIATWEIVQQLLIDERFGANKTKIHMAQNLPFTPIPDSWETGRNILIDLPEEQAKEKIQSTTAQNLTNRYPPYSIAGGVFDTLKSSNGMTWKVPNSSLFESARIFRKAEGVDIGPNAAVAVDALRQAVESGVVKTDERILLHITGGGKEIQYDSGNTFKAEPTIVVKPGDYKSVLEIVKSIPVINRPLKKLKQYKCLYPSKLSSRTECIYSPAK
jgi:cysteate synthase